MDSGYRFIFSLIFLAQSICFGQTENTWQIKKENPATGLTLGYSLPGNVLQEIVGNQFKPRLNAEGKGFLMLFIANAPKYYAGSKAYKNLFIAHILVDAEGSLNSPCILSKKNQKLNRLLSTNSFNYAEGKIELALTYKGDSVFTKAALQTKMGSIKIAAGCLNNPGDWKTIEAAKISAPVHPNNFLQGGETYRSIQIPSAVIESTGTNWITQLNLPSQPDRVWLNIDFSWDFKFMSE